MKIAVFPGSFDPFTVGHESVIKRALPLFDKIIIAIGENTAKQSFFPLEQRLKWIRMTFADVQAIEVDSYSGLTVDYCKRKDARFILRGLRTAVDFEYERTIAHTNKDVSQGIETVFLLTESSHSHINSSVVREIIKYGGDVSKFLPPAFARYVVQ